MKSNYWKDAPGWAQWIAWDCGGEAHYFRCRPVWKIDEFLCGGSITFCACPQHDDINKAGQLEKRPEEGL